MEKGNERIQDEQLHEQIAKARADVMPYYAEAREQGLKPILRVQFFKIGDENRGVHAQTEVTYPAELTDELFRMAHRKTLGAPSIT